MARVYRGEITLLAPVERAICSVHCASTRPSNRTGSPTRARSSSSPASSGFSSMCSCAPRASTPSTQRDSTRPRGTELQHHVVLHHQHQLAVLRRGDDALLLLADDRPGGAELHLRRRRHLGGDRSDPRLRCALGHLARQLLAGPHALAALRAAAHLLRGRAVPGLPGGDPDARCLCAGGDQTLALGPVASQEAIKMLGTNGGGFFNVNSAMPFENPTGLSNFVEMLLILIIPAGPDCHVRALCRQPPPGLGPLRRHADHVRGLGCCGLRGRG